jgi:hypothetical protein
VLADERAQLVEAVDGASHGMSASMSRDATSCYECRPCRLLTSYAASQPDKLAVIDDRLGRRAHGDVRRARGRQQPLAHVLAGHGVGPGAKVVWCGQNSLGIVDRRTRPARSGPRPCR